FAYREEESHDEKHDPMISERFAPLRYLASVFDVAAYSGRPVGERSVTMFAELTITRGDRVLADYVAQSTVSKSYTLYHEPTHRELENEAREQVRAQIDQKLYADDDRVMRE